jgi:signal transduction histidine kinase
MSLALEKFHLRDLITESIEITGSLAREKGLYLRMENFSEAISTVTADRTRMRQVLINIISNAVKFTPQGGIAIHAEIKDENTFRIRVKDTGIGVPPDKLEMIFEAFSQVDTSTTRKAGGTGLGLPISRRLVEMHGGHLWAESSGIPGEGSTFFVELPFVASKTA